VTKRILLINSDLAKNRGDRAIAEGNILLIRERFPDAIITGISELPERDREWYGIDFLDMNFQSISPFDLLRLCRFARTQDIVLWGGGEILKDYTNKAALWYWVLKMSIIRRANNNVYGMYQGIGPTKSAFSRKLITYTVNRSKHFIVRDEESRDKLVAWGADAEKVTYASDPAVLPSPDEPNAKLLEKLGKDYDIKPEFLENFVCIGPRDWFHYKTGGIIPFKYTKKLSWLAGGGSTTQDPENKAYREQLAGLVTHVTEELRMNVLLVPMHMEESDVALCEQLKIQSPNSERIRILANDTLSPSEIRSCMSTAQLMIGFRLHSNIVAVSSGVPSLNIYYVDKGRVFFDQIKQSDFAVPIESVLRSDFSKTSQALIQKLLGGRIEYKAAILAQTNILRRATRSAWDSTMDNDAS
jgi:polysaccharide pyruvyl transferase WcaK-like protein